MVFAPLDGRITSQNVLSGPLNGGEVMEIVSPGNAAAGVTYQVTTNVLGGFFGAFSWANGRTITAGATIGSPLAVLITDTRILFNKSIASASYATMPLAATMSNGPVLFKDLKGDAATNIITIQFTGGELCDGLATILIDAAYGWVIINPIQGGGGWYLT